MDKKKMYLNIHYFLLGLYVIITALFSITLVRLNILPMVYLLAVIVVLAGISIPIIKGLIKNSRSNLIGKKKITASSILAIIMIFVLSFGTFYLGGTLDFFGTISGDRQVQNYYVVVNADSEYTKIKDIKGQNVGLMDQTTDEYEDAKTKLKKKVDVEYEIVGNYDVLASSLLYEEYEVIFLNSAYYEMAIEEVDGFTEDTTSILEEITVVTKLESNKKSVDVTKDSFNIYVSGIDTSGSIGNISRSDVNMIVTVNPVTKTILLTSIPRDYYVELGTIGEYDKLTHSGLYGIDETTATIEKLFDIDINYFARVNFTTLVNLVDALGGITVESDYSFSKNGYDFVAGENYLDGNAALTFARERYSFVSGDNQRVKNQQAVISGIIRKVTGSTAILTSYNSILNSLENNFQTSLTQKEITSLVKMQLGDMRSWNIEQQSVVGSGDMIPVYSIPHMNVYVMHPDQSSVAEATQNIQAVADN